MTELKTLKDIFSKQIYDGLPEGELFSKAKYFIYKELKAEVIKWVKDIRKRADNPENMLNRDRLLTVQGWIIKFFNITEEDLK